MNIAHVAIWCADLETVREFYEKYFEARSGTKYNNQKTGFESYFLDFGPGTRLELMRFGAAEGQQETEDRTARGLAHFAISVGSEAAVDRVSNLLTLDGYQVVDGPRTTGDGYYEAVVLDPEGNRVELTI